VVSLQLRPRGEGVCGSHLGGVMFRAVLVGFGSVSFGGRGIWPQYSACCSWISQRCVECFEKDEDSGTVFRVLGSGVVDNGR
jgi:hypothetical protein